MFTNYHTVLITIEHQCQEPLFAKVFQMSSIFIHSRRPYQGDNILCPFSPTVLIILRIYPIPAYIRQILFLQKLLLSLLKRLRSSNYKYTSLVTIHTLSSLAFFSSAPLLKIILKVLEELEEHAQLSSLLSLLSSNKSAIFLLKN